MNATTMNTQPKDWPGKAEQMAEVARLLAAVPDTQVKVMLEVFRKHEAQGTINSGGLIDDLRLVFSS